MRNKFTCSILAAAVALSLGACSATAPVADKAQSAAVETQAEHSRVLQFEGSRNFRDLGGYKTVDGKTVKWGKLYRSGVLHNLTEAGYGEIEQLGIETVVDFRSTQEREQEPTEWQAGEIEHLTWDYEMGNWEQEFAKVFAKPDFAREDFVRLMDKGYVGLVQQQTPHYRAMFEELLEDDKPLLFHCTAGKDRTGIGAALILTALGVDRETVKQDYLLSNETLKDVEMLKLPEDASEKEKRMFAFFSQLPKEIRDVMAGVEASWLEAAFAEMERQHGSVEAYIEKELDVDGQELALLRTRYLQ